MLASQLRKIHSDLSAEVQLAVGIPAGNSKFLCVLHDLWIFAGHPRLVPHVLRVSSVMLVWVQLIVSRLELLAVVVCVACLLLMREVKQRITQFSFHRWSYWLLTSTLLL
jgi:hypothetical protein